MPSKTQKKVEIIQRNCGENLGKFISFFALTQSFQVWKIDFNRLQSSEKHKQINIQTKPEAENKF